MTTEKKNKTLDALSYLFYPAHPNFINLRAKSVPLNFEISPILFINAQYLSHWVTLSPKQGYIPPYITKVKALSNQIQNQNINKELADVTAACVFGGTYGFLSASVALTRNNFPQKKGFALSTAKDHLQFMAELWRKQPLPCTTQRFGFFAEGAKTRVVVAAVGSWLLVKAYQIDAGRI